MDSLWAHLAVGIGGKRPLAMPDLFVRQQSQSQKHGAHGRTGQLMDGVRTDDAARVLFPNGDTYLGPYSSDAKCGLGLYTCAATGTAYLGCFDRGKRDGPGAVALPDGGYYAGCFAADRFHGQARGMHTCTCRTT